MVLVVLLKKQDLQLLLVVQLFLAFSFENNVIPAGTGLLTTLDVVVVDFEACLEGVVISDPNAQEIDFEVGGCADFHVMMKMMI